MANDRLRDALMTARVTHEDLAADLGVNTKTVERWITQGRTPYPQFRHRISVLVQKDERWLWPDGYSRKRRGEITESEIVRDLPVPGRRARRAVGQAVRERDRQHRHPGLLRVLPRRAARPQDRAAQEEGRRRRVDPDPARRPGLPAGRAARPGGRHRRRDRGEDPQRAAGLLQARTPAIRASASGCTPRRCTTRSTGSTTTCWSTPTPTACPRTSPRSCTCGISAPGRCSRPTPAASTGYGTRPARPGPGRR